MTFTWFWRRTFWHNKIAIILVLKYTKSSHELIFLQVRGYLIVKANSSSNLYYINQTRLL